MLAFHEDPDLGIDEEGALHKWLVLCGGTPFDKYLLDFVRREIASKDKLKIEIWQRSLSLMLSAALRGGWPISRIEGIKLVEQQKRLRNAEESLVACINACSRALKSIAPIIWPVSNSFGSMVKRLQGQRIGPANPLIMNCLSYLDVSNQYIDIADLYSSDLSNTSFRGAQLNYTTLMLANLSNCDFFGAKMMGCNISSSRIDGCRIPVAETFNFSRRRTTERLLENEHETRSGNSPRNFVASARRLISRGALLVDDEGNVILEEALAEFFGKMRR